MIKCVIPYEMKYWQEYYLAKHLEKHFGKRNIGDLDKIMCINYRPELLLTCTCWGSGISIEAHTVERCICGHHVSQDWRFLGSGFFSTIPLEGASFPTALRMWLFTCWLLTNISSHIVHILSHSYIHSYIWSSFKYYWSKQKFVKNINLWE